VRHKAAAQWLESVAQDEAVAISELILAEFYGLLRNPAVLKHPLPADEAVEVIQAYRTHPRWRLIGFPIESRPLHDTLWQRARAKDFAFRKLYDARSALTMTSQGVTEFATVNVKDFEGLGFRKVFNPL
jgi:predicted nucleic acid-binding protein